MVCFSVIPTMQGHLLLSSLIYVLIVIVLIVHCTIQDNLMSKTNMLLGLVQHNQVALRSKWTKILNFVSVALDIIFIVNIQLPIYNWSQISVWIFQVCSPLWFAIRPKRGVEPSRQSQGQNPEVVKARSWNCTKPDFTKCTDFSPFAKQSPHHQQHKKI